MQRFQSIVSFAFMLSISTSVLAQGTYPVFPNITDHFVSDQSKLLGASGSRLVYFEEVDEESQLWISDGTPDGTKRVSHTSQTEIALIHHDTSAWYFTERRGTMFHISVLTEDADTLMPLHTSGIWYQSIVFWQNKFAWIQNSAGSGYSRLQLYDPATASLVTLSDLDYLKLRAVGGSDSLLFFIASTDEGMMLGSSDGTIAGTKFVKTLYPAGSSFDQQSRFFSNGKKVYFFYHPQPDPFVLWTTDGTEEGTIALGEFQDPDFGWPDDPAIFLEDKLFFILRELGAPSGTTFDLHATDGTPEGTVTLDNDPDSYALPRDLTFFDAHVYFVSFSWGADLRVSDGTIEGTEVVLDAFGHQSGGIGVISALGTYENSLVIQAFENVHGAELYIGDGTSDGTHLLSDVIRGATSADPEKFVQVGDRLFFVVEFAGRQRLWIYDPEFTFSCDNLSVDSLEIHPVTDSTLGYIAITMKGGQQPYTYNIDGANAEYSSMFANLSAGTHTLIVTDNLGCTFDTIVTIEEPSSVLEPELLRSIAIHPNPSPSGSGITLTLDVVSDIVLNEIKLSVYSPEGKLYHESHILATASEIRHHIDTQDWPQGQYYLSLQTGGRSIGNEILIVQ